MRTLSVLTSLAFTTALVTTLVACQPSTDNAAMTQASQKTASNVKTASGFDQTLTEARAKLDAAMARDITVPTPKDAGGGYTHEKHKDNAKLIYDAGQLYSLTGEEKYGKFAIDLMEGYAKVYPSWGLHPAKKEQSPGRMFWQNLNESWWLVHVAQGYGVVKNLATAEEQADIETNLLRNVADFLSEDSPETFNKIHNHGTWATAAVGLTGFAIGDDQYVEQALTGLDTSGNYGFLKQLDQLFSPDGYYNEGPYYQRYALMPFVVFAHAVDKYQPERKIFEHRNGILDLAIATTIEQSYNGLFFPINDALKDKGIATTELLYGVSIAYDRTGDPGLLTVAEAQGKFVLTPESRKVAEDLARGNAKPFEFKTMRLRDGRNGDEGALDILRGSGSPKDLVLVMKNTSQGLGHGHFDKMGFLLYDNLHEILMDYGAARFLNIEAKYGGHYLPENNSFAKQTIAHNALTIDGTSHFNGDTKTGNKYHPQVGVFLDTPNLKISSAKIDTAYPGIELSRTMAIVKDDALARPVVFDLMSAKTDGTHQYDLPFYYNGQLIETNFPVAAYLDSRRPLGTKNGYQHIWDTARAKPVDGLSQVTWLKSKRFYTISSDVPETSEIIFGEVGATDPNFNLRKETTFILRAKTTGGVSFASVIEPHGEYNPTVEYTLNSHSQLASIEQFSEGSVHYVQATLKSGQVIGLGIADDSDAVTAHTLMIGDQAVSWTGSYKLFHSALHKSGVK